MGTWGCFILGRDPGNAGYASRDCWVREGSSWLDGELLMLGTLRRVVDRYAGNEGDALLADVPVVMPLSEYGAVADWTEGGVGNAYWTESVQKADWVELNRLPPTWDLLPVVLSLLVGKLQTIDLALVLEMNWIPDGLHSRLCPNYGYRTNYGYRISLCYLNGCFLRCLCCAAYVQAKKLMGMLCLCSVKCTPHRCPNHCFIDFSMKQGAGSTSGSAFGSRSL